MVVEVIPSSETHNAVPPKYSMKECENLVREYIHSYSLYVKTQRIYFKTKSLVL